MSKKLTKHQIVEKFVAVHGNSYKYDDMIYNGINEKVKIWCNKHKKYFWQVAYSHAQGFGCPECSKIVKLTTQRFIEKAEKVHGVGTFDYSKVDCTGSKIPVNIICSKGHNFWQKPNNHLSGKGCPDCYGNRVKNTSEFILKAIKIHGDEFDYSKSEYNGKEGLIEIFCKNHNGPFWQKANIHLMGSKCNICAKNKKLAKLLNDKFLQLKTINFMGKGII